MALVGNYSTLNKTPARFYCGGNASVRSNWSSSGALKNSYTHFGKLVGYQSGYGAPYAWSLPMMTGLMSSFTQSEGLITPSVNLAGGRNLDASALLAIGVTNAQLDQIVTFVASALGQISVTNAELNASLVLSLNGTLTITANADIGAIVDVLASGILEIAPNVTLSALGYMEASAGGPTVLSPENLADAVWAKDITGYVDVNSAGKKLVDAGSAGNPWSADLSTNNTAGTFGYLVQKLLTVAKFIGLK